MILSWIKEGSRVLDVGCGDGMLGEALMKKKECLVFGIDLDAVAVAEAKRRGVKARVFDADDKLPFKNNQFDVVICNEVLQYTQNPDVVLSELLRVGEHVIISFPNFGFWFYRLQFLFGRFPRLSLYGHEWYETKQTRFFSLNDFFDLPSVKRARVRRIVCIDWKNREVSFSAKFFPNLFGRSCILELEKTMNIPK